MARLPWDDREQLLLEAIRDLEDDDAQLRNPALQQMTGLSAGDVGRGLQALLDGGFISGSDTSDLSTAQAQRSCRASDWRPPAAYR